MCTLTWWRGGGGEYAVFFNRDEKKTRPSADEPREFLVDGVRFLSPRDPAGGGTWMLVNEFGVILCLLNRWHEEIDDGRQWQSRGLLVWSLAGLRSAAELEKRLRGRDLAGTRPFSLWACDRAGIAGWDWTRGELRAARPEMPVTSSSFRFDEVAAARRERFATVAGENPAALASFHAGAAEASALTVRMCRPDAQTMSRSEVRVDPGGITWRYLAEQPGLAGPPDEFCSSLVPHSS
jgi:hypothetical protein